MSGGTGRLARGPRGRGGIFLLSLWDRMVVGTHCIPRLPLGTIIIYVHPCTHLYIPCGRPSDACRECTGGSVQNPIPGGTPTTSCCRSHRVVSQCTVTNAASCRFDWRSQAR